jgi:serine/threonine protein kinase
MTPQTAGVLARAPGVHRRGIAPVRATPKIAGYQVRRRLGRGRWSTAWVARDLRRGEDLVLKILDAAHTGDAARRAAFAREFEIALAIRGPHVIRVYDHSNDGPHCFIAMEYLDAGDLAGRIRSGIAGAQASLLMRQAALGLAQLHRRALVHCDVKPANFLVRPDGSLALADFGLARRAGEAGGGAEGTVFGTPCYAAPEQTQGAVAAPAADVYSLGAVFYEMLCATPPFAGPSALELQCQHLMAPVPRMPEGAGRFQPLIDAMLEKDAHLRLPDADAVLHRLDLIASR